MNRFLKIILTCLVIVIWGFIVKNIEAATGVKPSRSLLVAVITVLMIISIGLLWKRRSEKS